MEDHNRTLYDTLLAKEQKLLSDVQKNRLMLEQVAEELGEQPPPLELSGEVIPTIGNPGTTFSSSRISPYKFNRVEIKNGEFYPKSLADSVRIYLERRGKDEAVPFPEILEALRQGGFQMKSGTAEEERLRLNLLKSTRFTLIPPNSFGLAEVFSKRKRRGEEKRGRKPNKKKGASASKKAREKKPEESKPE